MSQTRPLRPFGMHVRFQAIRFDRHHGASQCIELYAEIADHQPAPVAAGHAAQL